MNEEVSNGVLHGAMTSVDRFILERPRLNVLLEKAIEKMTVFVIAGEGYGKTYAVHSFLRQTGKKAIWISLSERDNTLWRFWESIIKAVSYHEPRAGKLLKETGFPESPGQIERCLSALSDITSNGEKYIVVMDDCHLLQKEAVLNFVEKLLGSSFPGQTAILISRAELNNNAMILLSKGLLSRITADDLRFNEEEICAYFHLHGIALTGEESKEIFNDTEGWIQAISLIAEEMKSEKKKYSRSILESGSFRIIEEILFTSVPASLRRFLIILSLFEQWPLEAMNTITASLPDKIPPLEELADKLKRLSSLIRYDAYLHGFRFHRVFLDYLREKQKYLTRDEKRTAYTIAARWCTENSLHMDAAYYYAMAGNYEGLAKTIYSLPRLISHSVAASILEILDRVLHDKDRNESDHYFLFLRHVTRAAVLLNLGRYTESGAVLDASVRKFEAMPPCDLNFWILSACYYSLGPLSLINYRKNRDLSHTLEYFKLGSYYHKLYPYTVSGPGTKLSIGSYANQIGYPPRPGEFEQFIMTIEQCVPYASESLGGFLYGMDSLCRAELAFFTGDLNTAEQHAMEAVFKARKKEQYEVESKGLFYLLRIHIFNGNVSASTETWEQIETQLDIPDYINRYVINDIITGWFHAHSGKIDQIAPWLKNEFEESNLNLDFHNFETMVKAKSLFASGQYQETLRFLERKEVREGLCSFHFGMLEISALKAAILNRMGDEVSALETLEAAWKMSASHGREVRLDMPFIELGEDMHTLTGAALISENNTIPKSWLETIRRKASVYAKKLTAVKEQYGREEGIKENLFLSSQELSVLKGISLGFTREDIAIENSISLNTVKNVIRTIYGKLGALNRADAIRLATKAGLLK